MKMLKIKRISKTKTLFLGGIILLILTLSFLVQNRLFKTQKLLESELSKQETKAVEPSPGNQKVLDAVIGLKEVTDFKKLLEDNNKSKLGLRVTNYPDIGKPYFLVQVYEDFPDHTATFNWYRVSINGEISRQDLSEFDKWDTIYPVPSLIAKSLPLPTSLPSLSPTPSPTAKPNSGKEAALKLIDEKEKRINELIAFWQNNINLAVQRMDGCGDRNYCVEAESSTINDFRQNINVLVRDRNDLELQRIQIISSMN